MQPIARCVKVGSLDSIITYFIALNIASFFFWLFLATLINNTGNKIRLVKVPITKVNEVNQPNT